MNRRTFVESVSCGGAAALLAGCASLVTHSVTPVNGVVRLDPARMPDLAAANGAVRIQPAGLPDPIYVLRGADSGGRASYAALSPICTHRGCTVEAEGPVLVCPCHGSTFSRSGEVMRGPAERPLRSYPARLAADGMIEIEVGVPS